MTNDNRNRSWPWAAALALLATAALAQPIEPGQHASVDGIEIYYGLLPARLVGKHPPDHEERAMHGGISGRKDAYHLVVAVFNRTGERVRHADVYATVTELGMAGARKRLDPMDIDGAASYGSYFVLSGQGPYRIGIEAKVPGIAWPLEALFEYRRR